MSHIIDCSSVTPKRLFVEGEYWRYAYPLRLGKDCKTILLPKPISTGTLELIGFQCYFIESQRHSVRMIRQDKLKELNGIYSDAILTDEQVLSIADSIMCDKPSFIIGISSNYEKVLIKNGIGSVPFFNVRRVASEDGDVGRFYVNDPMSPFSFENDPGEISFV